MFHSSTKQASTSSPRKLTCYRHEWWYGGENPYSEFFRDDYSNKTRISYSLVCIYFCAYQCLIFKSTNLLLSGKMYLAFSDLHIHFMQFSRSFCHGLLSCHHGSRLLTMVIRPDDTPPPPLSSPIFFSSRCYRFVLSTSAKLFPVSSNLAPTCTKYKFHFPATPFQKLIFSFYSFCFPYITKNILGYKKRHWRLKSTKNIQ